MRKVKIKIADYTFNSIIYNTPTADAIFNSLPIKGKTLRWGDEIYFYIDIKLPLENDAKEDVEIGDLGYWPEGPAFCIFFGKTPVSKDDKPRAYSPVNIFGKITDNIDNLKNTKNGDEIIVSSF